MIHPDLLHLKKTEGNIFIFLASSEVMQEGVSEVFERMDVLRFKILKPALG